jgi:Kef-type K+ transport system membrane component KefB
MGCFFVSIGATCSAAGVSPGALAPLLAFIGVMVAVHWAVLLAGARLLRLEPSLVLVGAAHPAGSPTAQRH